MKPRPRHPRTLRRARPALDHLESRQLLTGPAAAWVGQDGLDLEGPYPADTPDGIQDVHVQITGLPTDRRVAWADLMGLGGGRWVYNGPYGPWHAAFQQAAGSTTADMYFEPDRVETGRAFNLVLHYDDGSTADLWFNGGTADPTLRMADARLQLAWGGQSGSDKTGVGPAVGPDGFVDAVLNLQGLAKAADIVTVRIDGPPGISWVYGVNSQANANAELVRNPSDPSQGQLYFSPDRDLQGQTLSVQVVYATGQTDSAQVAAGATNPALPDATTPLPSLVTGPSAQWGGQVTGEIPGLAGSRGWVTLDLANLPAGRSIVAAAVSGVTNALWAYRAPGVETSSFYTDPYAGTLALLPAEGGTPARLAFAPDSRLAGQRLSIRLRFDDGTEAVTTALAGATDLSQLSPTPSTSTIVAGQGADVQKLVQKYGRVLLSPGVYTLSQPLVLNSPVSLIAPYGNVTLLFSQSASDAPWTAAIKINAGNTTLDGFSVRFNGSVRWNANVKYGPAVIGSTDNLDPASADPKANLTLTRLDLECPPPATQGEQAPNLIRLTSAAGGQITSNRLRGGTTVVLRGPWSITGNTYLGTVPGTWAWEAFATHFTNDLVLANNVVSPLPDSGRTWRFLVMTQSGLNDRIENNRVSGIGPLDTDTQTVNASELILTESYAVRFEGRPLGLSADGTILRIPPAQGDTPATGDVVAILDGPNAGQWRRIAQVLDPTTLLLADPLPVGNYDVSIAPGFVNESFTGNTLDLRGSSTASAFVLVGNHYGTQLGGNTTYGGGEAIRVVAFPSERPVHWGWTHNPFLGGTINNNTVIDATKGITLSVDNSSGVKSTKGRVYFQATAQGNTIRWTSAFLAARAGANLSPPVAMTIGDQAGLDPAELALTLGDNWADVPPDIATPTAVIHVAEINGQDLVDTSQALPLPPPGAPLSVALIDDTGFSATDGVTSDPRLKVGAATGATSYAYRLGNSGPFLPVADPSQFLPAGLSQGPQTVFVRGQNADGTPGPALSLTFRLETTPPVATPARLRTESDTGASSTDGVTNALTLNFQVDGNPSDVVTLLRDGTAVAQGSAGVLTDPGPIAEGAHFYTVRRTDLAGNTSISPPLQVVLDRTPPAPVTGLAATGTTVSFLPIEPGGSSDYRVGTGRFQAVPTSAGFTPLGIRPGVNVVQVRAVDQAGNAGPVSTINVLSSPGPVTGQWLGQDGKDFVGPSPIAAPDGVQDIHIRLTGLPTNRLIRFVDIQGYGGSRWQFGAPWGNWKAAVYQQRLAGTADIYMQPDRKETGRPFQITIFFGDGSTSRLWLQGGTANPVLKVQPNSRRVPINIPMQKTTAAKPTQRIVPRRK